MPEKSSIFDMIGPVMIGPSSSHTAGVVRIGRVAYKIFGGMPEEATITFYNSFARTYEGHGSDRAIIAGLMGFKTDDPRIKTSFDHAAAAGLRYTFKPVGNASAFHPNTIHLHLRSGERTLDVLGVSRGGGLIMIEEVNGFTANFAAGTHTLIILAEDKMGAISFISNVLAHDECNIASMSVSRKGKHEMACHFIEMDSAPRPITLEYLRSIRFVQALTYLTNVDD